MVTEFEEVDKMAQAVRRKMSRPLTEELQAAYYQRMSPELRKQWDLLAPEEQVMILEVLEEYHQMMEYELSHLVSGLIQALIKRH